MRASSARRAGPPRRVLVVRNDKLGDFTLALPAFEVLRRGLPEAELVAFVPEYTRPIAELSPWIDAVEPDPGPQDPAGAARPLAVRWRERGYDALLVLWSSQRVALAGFLAGVPERVAPATKVFQVLYNRRVAQRRSRSVQPEYAYNVDLARHLLTLFGIASDASFTRPQLALDAERVAARRAALCERGGLDPELPLVVAHPGHGGSANNLDAEQYGRLLAALSSPRGHSFVLTAGPGEGEKARAIARALDRPCLVHASTAGLAAFCEVLAAADLVVGGSTGPLHLAGALDRPTAGFYVRRRTSSALRWQTLNSPERRLAFWPPEPAHERDLGAIDLEVAAREIGARFLAGGAPERLAGS